MLLNKGGLGAKELNKRVLKITHSTFEVQPENSEVCNFLL